MRNLLNEYGNVYDIRQEKVDFSQLKIGTQSLQDPTFNLSPYKTTFGQFGDKDFVLRTLKTGTQENLAALSNHYYKTNGIYNKLCNYMADLYKYDWMVTPHFIYSKTNFFLGRSIEEKKQNKMIQAYFSALTFLDNSNVKMVCKDIALKVIKNGCYYGYMVDDSDGIILQELPSTYCRSRFKVQNVPVVEFNLDFFDKEYPKDEERERVLKAFPAEFNKLYKTTKSKGGGLGTSGRWAMLNTARAVKFTLNDADTPIFASIIPDIINLEEAKEIDRQRMIQKLLRIIIQKVPLDKNNVSTFDTNEIHDLHTNAVRMLGDAIGVDVLTTFADVNVADMSDRSNSTQKDDLMRVERQVYNAAGVPENLFNSDSNLAISNSIKKDEALIENLVLQFQAFFNKIIQNNFYEKNTYYLTFSILPTTIFNYQEMAKMYKEQTKIGYSKILPQVALGISQNDVLSSAVFENSILGLNSIFVPPMSSNTMSSKTLKEGLGEDKEKGRPNLEDKEKSEKTIANEESL